jgi:hypothetical protein
MAVERDLAAALGKIVASDSGFPIVWSNLILTSCRPPNRSWKAGSTEGAVPQEGQHNAWRVELAGPRDAPAWRAGKVVPQCVEQEGWASSVAPRRDEQEGHPGPIWRGEQPTLPRKASRKGGARRHPGAVSGRRGEEATRCGVESRRRWWNFSTGHRHSIG